MRHFLRDALITLGAVGALLVIAAFASLNALFFGTTAPGRVEASLADRARRLAIPADARQARNPFAAEKDAWREALPHFAEHCESCHGYDGRGGGEIGRHLNPRVPDLAASRTQSLTDGELFYIIQHGVRWTGMPAWQDEHTAGESWLLVSFVRHVPSLTAAEMRSIVEATGREHAHPHEHGQEHGHPES